MDRKALIGKLTQAGPRLPWIAEWLLSEVWSRKKALKAKPLEFMKTGEQEVNSFEALICAAAPRVYDELLVKNPPHGGILRTLSDRDTAVIVFDGLSLREVPTILSLAERSGMKIGKVATSIAAIPSETVDFVERELPCGRIGPSQLPGRKELKAKGIACMYQANQAQSISIDPGEFALLIWSAFPDQTYTDSGAKFENHVDNIQAFFETAWNTAVMPVRKKRIIVTSDHGYIFFGVGMDAARSGGELKDLNAYFGNDRGARMAERPNPPPSPDVHIDQVRGVALVRGRVRTRGTGEAATRLYRHGGLSLMEMITPWIELERFL
jgi:hypothetical protein